MYIAWYGKIKEGKVSDYAKFWRNKENVEQLKNSLTDGMKLIGVYFTILDTTDYDVEVWYEIDNWEVLDRDRENSKMREFNKQIYEKYGNVLEWSRSKVFRSAVDVKFIFD